MTAYLVGNYRITNPEGYEPYVPAAVATLLAHGAELIVGDYATHVLEGAPGNVPSSGSSHRKRRRWRGTKRPNIGRSFTCGPTIAKERRCWSINGRRRNEVRYQSKE